MVDPASIEWTSVSLIIAGFVIAVVCSRLVRVWMDILEAKKMQKTENLQPLLGVVSPNFDQIVKNAKDEDVAKRNRK